MLFWSSGEITSSSVPHLNNSDSILFCWGTELRLKLNHIVPNPVCGSPFSLYLLSSMASKNGEMPMGGRYSQPLMTESILWCWWLDRQLLCRVFVNISLMSISVLKGRRKLAFMSLDSVTFCPCSTHCSLHSPCHRSHWNSNLNLSQPERARYSNTSTRTYSGRSALLVNRKASARVSLNVCVVLSIKGPLSVIRVPKCYPKRKVIIERSLHWLVKIPLLE